MISYMRGVLNCRYALARPALREGEASPKISRLELSKWIRSYRSTIIGGQFSLSPRERAAVRGKPISNELKPFLLSRHAQFARSVVRIVFHWMLGVGCWMLDVPGFMEKAFHPPHA